MNFYYLLLALLLLSDSLLFSLFADSLLLLLFSFALCLLAVLSVWVDCLDALGVSLLLLLSGFATVVVLVEVLAWPADVPLSRSTVVVVDLFVFPWF
jgi:hypothetical protein